MKIMIVDDNSDNLMLIKLLLTNHGYDVITAGNGADALEKLKDHSVNLIISDILMPVVDGFQLCARVRQNEKLHHIPFIFYTATYTDQKDEELGFKLGADRFLHKPLDTDTFLNEIQVLIKNPRKYRDGDTIKEPAGQNDIFSLYSERLVNKLERRNLELEKEIQKRKKIEKALLEAHRIARLGNWEYHFVTNQLYCSEEVYRILEVGKEELHSDFMACYIQLIHKDERKQAKKELEKMLESAAPLQTVHRLSVRGGKEKYVHLKAEKSTDSDTGFTRLVGTIQDITTIKKAETDLKVLNQAIEQNPTTVIITDIDGVIQYVNPKFTEVTGYKPAEVMGKKPNILNSGVQTKSFFKEMWDTILSGKSWTGEICNRKKDGALFWENASISPIFNDKGEIIYFIAVKEDITTKKYAELEKERALEEARQANEVKTHFMTNMSHELRTPLNSILGFSDLVKMEVQDLLDEEKLEYFDNIATSGERLKRTMHEILEISELESGSVNLIISDFNLSDVVEYVVLQHEPEANEKGLDLIYNCTLGSVRVTGDKQLISGAIDHIVDNAVKYTEKGKVLVSILEDSQQFILVVKDTGIGMSEKYLNELFDVFTQESSGYSKKYQGVGLGLSLTKRYLDLNNVSVEIQSKNGRGTTFTLFFPKDNSGLR